MSQLYVLWASGQMPALLPEADRASLLQRVRSLQLSDGGWSLFSLDAKDSWARLNGSQQSDGCATGLVVVAMEQSGVDRQDDSLRRGLEWLMHHQSTDGSWLAVSLNVRRNPDTDIGRFMSDAATGYAVMALAAAQQTEPSAGGNHALNTIRSPLEDKVQVFKLPGSRTLHKAAGFSTAVAGSSTSKPDPAAEAKKISGPA